MKNLLTIVAILSTTSALANLDSFAVKGGNAKATFTKAQVLKMLGEGNTCIKKGVSVKYHSANITKKHCQSSTKLGLRVIKVNQLEMSLYKQVMGFKG